MATVDGNLSLTARQRWPSGSPLKAETRVRSPLGPPFDARRKLSRESFPRLRVQSGVEGLPSGLSLGLSLRVEDMAGLLRLESRFSRVEWCPERATEDPRASRGQEASRRAPFPSILLGVVSGSAELTVEALSNHGSESEAQPFG